MENNLTVANLEEIKKTIATWNMRMKNGTIIIYKNNQAERYMKPEEIKKIADSFEEKVNLITEQNADIVVITEIALFNTNINDPAFKGKNVAIQANQDMLKYLKQQTQQNDYIWFRTFKEGRNGILILVKKDLVEMEWNYTNIEQTNDECNFLRVTFNLSNGKSCSVIGVRMINKYFPTLRETYDNTGKSFLCNVIPRVSKCSDSDIVIVAGDFNNAQYHADANGNPAYKGKSQENYNWHFIKSAFECLGYTMCDCDCGYYYKDEYNNEHRECVFTCGLGPIDHIFVKGLIKDDTFEPKNKKQKNPNGEYKYCDVIDSNLSDHRILIAGVKIL